eukprot:scaffold5887_cov122-Cylindrotheca_fusiformis.AAC.5
MRLTSLLLSAALVVVADGFQFMKNWKLPSRDRSQQIATERFGDKSKFFSIVVLSAADMGMP